jgi:hypothetical protein
MSFCNYNVAGARIGIGGNRQSPFNVTSDGDPSILLSLGHAQVSSGLHIVPVALAPACLQAFERVHETSEHGTFFIFGLFTLVL